MNNNFPTIYPSDEDGYYMIPDKLWYTSYYQERGIKFEQKRILKPSHLQGAIDAIEKTVSRLFSAYVRDFSIVLDEKRVNNADLWQLKMSYMYKDGTRQTFDDDVKADDISGIIEWIWLSLLACCENSSDKDKIAIRKKILDIWIQRGYTDPDNRRE